MINHVRHQQDGYLVTAGMGYGIGLDKQSHGYYSLGIHGTYSRLLNRFFQLDAGFVTGYTTADLQSISTMPTRAVTNTGTAWISSAGNN